MDKAQEDKLREELESAQKELLRQESLRDYEQVLAQHKIREREAKASNNTALIVFIGGIVLTFLVVLFQ